jgi:hypothetical protein
MKKCFLVAMVLSALQSQSQNAVQPIDVNFFKTISNSSNYYYNNNAYITYIPYSINWNNSGMQTRYDWAVEVLRFENSKFLNLKLINRQQVTTLNAWHISVPQGLKNLNQVDLSIWTNYTQALAYLTEFFNIPTVRDEIELLHKIDIAIFRLREADPDNFHTSAKFYNLVSLMNEIYNADRSDISKLGYKYGLF